jgi:hypothetical protein
MPAKKTTKKQSKSAFIRENPSLSTAQVIAAGKKAGLKISSSLVYMVRGRAGKAKKDTKTPPTIPSSKAPTTSKAEFVRARAHLSPKEIVEDAKAAGMKFGVHYVYSVRGASKQRGVVKTMPAKVAARRAVARQAAPIARPITTAAKAEDLLRAVASEVGLGRAIEVLEAERARVHAVLRG